MSLRLSTSRVMSKAAKPQCPRPPMEMAFDRLLTACRFLGYLRPGEAAALRRHDVPLPLDGTCSLVDSVVLVISSPKTRPHAAHIQSVYVPTLYWLCWVCAVMDASRRRRAFVLATISFAKRFKALPSAAGLCASHCSPTSLRGGRAAADLLRRCSLICIMLHWQWARDRPCAITSSPAWHRMLP